MLDSLAMGAVTEPQDATPAARNIPMLNLSMRSARGLLMLKRGSILMSYFGDVG